MQNTQRTSQLSLEKTFIVSMTAFLLIQGLLPQQYHTVGFLFIVLNTTILWVIAMMESGGSSVTTTVRVLATYVALSALLVDERAS